MFGFGKKRIPRPRTRKRLTQEEKRKAWAERRLHERAESDPAAEAALIYKETGIQIQPLDDAKMVEKELDQKVTKMAIARIEGDEQLKQQATDAKIQQLLGGPRDVEREDVLGYPVGNEPGPLDIIRGYREIAAEFSSNNGLSGILKDPQVIAQALMAIRSLFGGNPGTAIGSSTPVTLPHSIGHCQ